MIQSSCPRCSAPIIQGQRFCGQCGQLLDPASIAALQGNARQKWEYLNVVCDWVLLENRWVPRVINGDVLPDWKKGDGLNGSLTKWGQEGWELIASTMTAGSGIGLWTLIFKRPLG